MNKPIKLNLGCGKDKRNGYIDIDADPKTKPDFVLNLTQKLPYSDNSVSEIIMQDVLEHLTKEEGARLLKECGRVLISSGKITIRVPNIPAILKKFKSQDDLVMLYLYGDTSQGKINSLHKYGYTPLLIKEACQKAGIKIGDIKKVDTNILIEGYSARSLPARMQGDSLQEDNILHLIFKTIILSLQKKEIDWKINKKYPIFLSKLLLRPLSRNVNKIICTKETEKFVKGVLQYSHLRTVIEDI